MSICNTTREEVELNLANVSTAHHWLQDPLPLILKDSQNNRATENIKVVKQLDGHPYRSFNTAAGLNRSQFVTTTMSNSSSTKTAAKTSSSGEPNNYPTYNPSLHSTSWSWDTSTQYAKNWIFWIASHESSSVKNSELFEAWLLLCHLSILPRNVPRFYNSKFRSRSSYPTTSSPHNDRHCWIQIYLDLAAYPFPSSHCKGNHFYTSSCPSLAAYRLSSFLGSCLHSYTCTHRIHPSYLSSKNPRISRRLRKCRCLARSFYSISNLQNTRISHRLSARQNLLLNQLSNALCRLNSWSRYTLLHHVACRLPIHLCRCHRWSSSRLQCRSVNPDPSRLHTYHRCYSYMFRHRIEYPFANPRNILFRRCSGTTPSRVCNPTTIRHRSSSHRCRYSSRFHSVTHFGVILRKQIHLKGWS